DRRRRHYRRRDFGNRCLFGQGCAALGGGAWIRNGWNHHWRTRIHGHRFRALSLDIANGFRKTGMKRNWNWPIWIGFVVAGGGLFSYEWFAQFPITRDFPWANLLLFGIGAVLLLFGLFCGFWWPLLYRGIVFGSLFYV